MQGGGLAASRGWQGSLEGGGFASVTCWMSILGFTGDAVGGRCGMEGGARARAEAGVDSLG